ncbi:MAG: dodecin family protein [Planctomycetota bacterium]
MSVAKVIEISARSGKSFEDAVEQGVQRACKTCDDVRGVWIKEQKLVVADNKIAEYQVDMKVTFVLHG